MAVKKYLHEGKGGIKKRNNVKNIKNAFKSVKKRIFLEDFHDYVDKSVKHRSATSDI